MANYYLNRGGTTVRLSGGLGLNLGGGGGSNPNEPAGMTVGFDEPWNTSPNGRPATSWQTDSSGTNFSIITDATAPRSPSNVFQVKYPSGMGGGGAPDHCYWNADVQGGTNFPTNTGTLYMRVWMKISADWSDNGNSGTKFVFLRDHASYGGGTNGYIGLTDGGGSGLWKMGYYTNGGFMPPNSTDNWLMSGSLTKGAWHDLEFLISQGSTAAANNASFKMWADGTLVANYSGLKIDPDGTTLGWTHLMLDPTFGGGFNPVPHDQFIWIDHWYASVK